ncbi:hypothetical protein ACFVYF_21885 [Streptomyces sp. NPDC058274]|uniref:hypothetical protein n=1 Tax=Streptomyces sp. NPDC058274 TaxID=3346416 RepID=UPI0036E48FA5
MPADEVTHVDSAGESRARTGPRHAAPRKPLLVRLNVPAGKAIALAAMPTAVLMGMGLTPTLALADDHPSSKSLTADEYQKCVDALDGAKDASASPSPSASTSSSASPDATPTPSATPSPDKTSSPDSGSDDKGESTPAPTASKSSQSGGDTATPAPSASASSSNPLDPLGLGDALKDILTPDKPESSTPTPSATPSASASKDASDPVKDTTDKVTETAKDTVDKAGKTVEDTTDKAKAAAKEASAAAESAAASATPSPSASASTDADGCPTSTDDEGGVEKTAALPDDPWYLNASSLLLKGADYQGVVKVRTANGTVKEVLKYVISGGTDIGDLHQTTKDAQSGKTYHVQAAKGSTSTIRNGDTVMYTESISGNLFGLIPVTFDPDNPPPLNIPLIYFTNVKVTQAGQFGGDLTVPGLHQYVS